MTAIIPQAFHPALPAVSPSIRHQAPGIKDLFHRAMAPLGLKLMKTRRMSLKKESIKDRKQLGALLKTINEDTR